MKEFDKLAELHEDFAVTWAAFKTAHNDAAEVIAAVEARLDMERTRNEERLAELQRTMSDPSRSQTVRRVAGAELSRIRDRKISATQEEVAAFAALVREQEGALLDLKKIQTEFLEAFNKAGQHMKKIRADVLGHKSLPVASNWITRQQHEFAKLCDGGVGNE